jgi:glycolate oxidase FAD binding subunit
MSMAAATISDSLSTIVGPQHVISEPEKLGAYRISGLTPEAAVRPGSVEEVAALVRLAAADKFTIVPVGARSKLAMNIPIGQYDVGLDMTRFDKIVSYDPADLTLSVEAGLPLQALRAGLSRHRQFLPLAVPFSDSATVGGAIASGLDSPVRQVYGTARDFVLGMEFVTGEGKIVKSGGRVVKNVSGYDLHKLMIGSFGSLGVLTKINFRTFPSPSLIRAVVASFDSIEEAIEARHRIAHSPLRPLSLEILNPRAIEILSSNIANRISPGDLSLDSRWQLIVSFSGTEKVIERYQCDLKQLAGTADHLTLDETHAITAVARVQEFVPIALDSSPSPVIIKFSVVPTRMTSVLGDAVATAENNKVPFAAMARGAGVIYLALLPSDQSEDEASRTSRVISDLYDSCGKCEANISALCIPEAWRGRISRPGAGRNDISLMRKIKSAFDPQGIFAADPLSTLK